MAIKIKKALQLLYEEVQSFLNDNDNISLYQSKDRQPCNLEIRIPANLTRNDTFEVLNNEETLAKLKVDKTNPNTGETETTKICVRLFVK